MGMPRMGMPRMGMEVLLVKKGGSPMWGLYHMFSALAIPALEKLFIIIFSIL